MKLNSTLFDIPIINNILFYDTISSTNDRAKELARRGSVHGSLVVAKTQTAGKGRLGRSFQSKSNDGLYFSLMLRPHISSQRLSGITLVTALAVSNAINGLCNANTTIKWPNDIYLNGKKIVGILTEAGNDYVVIGIGINVNNNTLDDAISGTASSIILETGTYCDKANLLNSILLQFNSIYNQFISESDLSFIINSYNNSLGCLGKDVYIIPQERTLTSNNTSEIITSDLDSYLCLGIDKFGNLLCQDSLGIIHYVNSGEVSLRVK